jgi:hypothetical protein
MGTSVTFLPCGRRCLKAVERIGSGSETVRLTQSCDFAGAERLAAAILPRVPLRLRATRKEDHMSFVTRMIQMFRKTPATQEATMDDLFDIRIRKMQGRQRLAPRTTPFRNSRLHSAA